MNLSTPEKLKEYLHLSLKDLETFQECALLSYPDHYNVGDHMIWLGNILYLTEVAKIKIGYVSSIEKFSQSQMENQTGKAPILIHGGGNFGDVWSYYQRFYEKIIPQYHDRKIIFLPQSIYFRYPDRLERAKAIFNAHPDLTICAREKYSYELASQHFTNCKIIQVPDMAFQLAGTPGIASNYQQQKSILYLYREDQEINSISSPNSLSLLNLVKEDWGSFRYKQVPKAASIAGIAWLFQDSWQQGSLLPREWLDRQIWTYFHSYASKFAKINQPDLHTKSWKFMHNGVYQFKRHRLIITSRLHGHILCLMMGIPHIFLANSYYKNQSFYETWTSQIPFCRFVKDASQIESVAYELLENYEL